jgi:putative ABC transport system substrate-binding protein
MMRRRKFIAGLGAAVTPVLWPLAAPAQQANIPVIGFLSTSPETSESLSEFRSGLKDAGYIEGQNVEFRWGNIQSSPQLAHELVRLQAAAIVAIGGIDSLLAAKAATSTVPIVYVGGGDPVKLGLAASLNRPGGNITGVTLTLNALAGKRLDLLLKLVPEATTVGYLVGSQVVGEVDELLASARILGRQIMVLECHTASDLESAFATMAEHRAGAVLVGAFPTAFANRKQVLALAAAHRVPAIYAQSRYVYEGGLMSYSPAGILSQVATQYVARILKGEKPADLPIQQPTHYEFIINLATAKTLGLMFPPFLHALADKAIE